MDMEKVLTWLEICGKNKDCSGCCPYSENGFGEYGQCRESLMEDAYDLLKEQTEEIKNLKQTAQSMMEGICLLKEQEAKPPIHVHEEYPEHDWETDEDGKIDEWAMSYEFHNGPMCKRCYHSFCIHCEPNGFNNGPCIIDKYKCPKCGCVLQKGTKFCSECGQAVKWK